jgi:glycosyltransferase involved in cell wall biosynthesis
MRNVGVHNWLAGHESTTTTVADPMQVLHVITDTDRRGAQVFAADLAGALRARGHRCDLVALAPGTTGGIDAEVIGRRRHDPLALPVLRSRMRAADITVAHGSSAGPACAVARLAGGGPFVYRQISDSRFWAPSFAKRLQVRTVLGRACSVVALSDFSARELVDYIGLDPTQIRVVPNGVPSTRFPRVTDAVRRAARGRLELSESPIVLFAAALVPEKGGEDAIAAVGALDAVQLIVAGDGPERTRLEELADQLAPGRVRFLGSVADMPTVYQASDVLLMPSRGGDTMPAALIEAGLSGLPIVATPVGAMNEVVSHESTGLVARSCDVPALVRALERLLSDEVLRRSLGAAAYSRCLERYEIEPVARRWEDVLTTAVGTQSESERRD